MNKKAWAVSKLRQPKLFLSLSRVFASEMPFDQIKRIRMKMIPDLR